MPLCALPIDAKPDDVAVRATALQAERLHLETGEFLEPLPDSGPCGASLVIIVRGRVSLVLAAQKDRPIILKGPTIFVEGVAAEHGLSAKILSTDFEAYRLRVSDLAAAARFDRPPNWFFQLRLIEQECRESMHSRFSHLRGLAQGRAPHRSDEDIRRWTAKREDSARKAKEIRYQLSQGLDKGGGTRNASSACRLPLLPSSDVGTTSYRCWTPMTTGSRAASRANSSRGSTKSRKSAESSVPACLPPLLAAYPAGAAALQCVRGLARARSEPRLRRVSSEKSLQSRKAHGRSGSQDKPRLHHSTDEEPAVRTTTNAPETAVLE